MKAEDPAYRKGLPTGLLTALVCAGGIALSVLTFRQAAAVEQARVDSDFARRTETRHALTTEIINNYEAGLFGLRNLFVASETVSRAQFDRVATDILARYPGITALEWAPVVPGPERANFERNAARETGRPYRIMTRDPAGNVIPAPEGAVYHPITYVEPLAGNELTMGLDLAVNPDRERARREQRMIATGVLTLVQGRSGIIMVWPIFKGEAFAGFLQAVFRIGELFEQTQKRSPSSFIDTLFVDLNATDPMLRILHFSPADPAASRTPPTEAEFRSRKVIERTIPLGGREWAVLYRPTPAWQEQQSTPRPLITLGAGLAITALLGALVHTLGRRNQAVEALVSRRTAELIESRRQIDSFLHELPGMAYRYRMEGSDSELVFVSEGALTLTGYSPEQFVSKDVLLRDLVHTEDLDRVRDETWEALKSRRDFAFEYRLRAKSGEERWVLSRGRGVYDEAGKLLMMEGLAVDVTLGKRAETDKLALERKLLESQKLESLGVLAGGIAHDFNNLLTTIMGNASLARLELDAAMPQQKKLRQIEITAVRAAELCQQMLAYSGKNRFVLERIDLSTLVEDALPLIQFSVAKSAEIQLALDRHLPPILADATQMRQIIMNLVMNASEALTDQAGRIDLATQVVEVAAAEIAALAVGSDLAPGRFVSLRVHDTGCGMAPETMARIFDPFFTTKFTGRGLGLAAVLGIVRSHHGGLRVESAPGGGSTFELLLPPTDGVAAEAGARVQPPTPVWQHTGTALVADDERDVRDVAVEILEKIGFTVVSARDGNEAVELFKRDPARFDFVLLDLTMPGRNGDEVLEQIRAANPRVPVVMMSGHADRELAERLRALATGFLTKPFAICTLVDAVRSALGADRGKG